MFHNQFRVNMVVPRIPQIQRIIACQLFSSVALDLQKSDEDEGGTVGGDEIAMCQWDLSEDMVRSWSRV